MAEAGDAPDKSQLADASDETLVNIQIDSAQGKIMNVGSGPVVEINRRLISATNQLRVSTDRTATISVVFGIVIGVLTLALVVLTLVLIFKPDT